jgi:hypothetical protein
VWRNRLGERKDGNGDLEALGCALSRLRGQLRGEAAHVVRDLETLHHFDEVEPRWTMASGGDEPRSHHGRSSAWRAAHHRPALSTPADGQARTSEGPIRRLATISARHPATTVGTVAMPHRPPLAGRGRLLKAIVVNFEIIIILQAYGTIGPRCRCCSVHRLLYGPYSWPQTNPGSTTVVGQTRTRSPRRALQLDHRITPSFADHDPADFRPLHTFGIGFRTKMERSTGLPPSSLAQARHFDFRNLFSYINLGFDYSIKESRSSSSDDLLHSLIS